MSSRKAGSADSDNSYNSRCLQNSFSPNRLGYTVAYILETLCQQGRLLHGLCERMNDRSAYGGFVYDQNLDNVKRQLGKHHIQMIALAGIIGTGLFLGLGQILALTGPLGSLLVFIHVATVVYATMVSVGEMTSYAPISGSFLLYAARWLDPAIGFALGWNYFYYLGTAIPLEITAFSAMIKFWDTNPDHTAIYITVITVALLLNNLFGVRWFGNSEIFFASLKIMLVLALYWRNPGPMVSALEPGAKGRFLGLLVSITPAVFAIGGIELISITVAETKQPRTNIIKAMRTVVFRLAFFFIASVIVVGMLVPSNDPALFKPGESAGQSPFVIAFQRAGVKVFPSVVNAVLLTSAFSAANTYIFSASRVLYGLAVQNKAPRIFTTCTQGGLPWVAVIASWLFSLLAFMNVATSSATVFNWLVSLVTMCGLIGWVTINTTYLRYYYGLKRQGITPRGIYRSPLQPYAALWAIFWVTFYILVGGISIFWEWNAGKFVAAYFNLPLFFLFFIGYKLWYKTKMTPLEELDFVSNIPTLEETGDEALLREKLSFAKKLRELI
ncbi:general amino acid permease 1 [Boletus reticuloceps]|uniref:General amino acid permease 1 n=1 Tax=Boletus reticuloceps TaxID=495285 RepID=A0A8I3AEE8_9AGAM|nr:general amino acid permease 1 [Boletus reticuloceps]